MTTSQRRLRIGVIGVGFGATVHVPGFLSEGWEVPVLWGRRTEVAREKATALGVSDVAEDWREIVARDDLDAVAVTTPPAVHYQIVAAALRAGKHVLCEKPFALNLKEARGMRDLAVEHERTAMIAHEFRFAPQRAQIKDLLDEGRVGTPELVSAELLIGRPQPDSPPPYTWAADTRQGGGLLGALGSHYIDGFRHWFGEVTEVSGRLITRNPNRLDADGQLVQADADDGFSFSLRFRSGVVASMTASSQVAPSLGARITIAGSDGVLVATQRGPNPEPDGVVLAGRPEDRELKELAVDPRYMPIEDNRDHRLPAFRLLVREFGRGIREGSSPAPNFDDGVACQQVLDAVRLAAASGQTVFPDGTPIGGRGDANVALIPGGGGANRFDRFAEAVRRAMTEAQVEAQRRGDGRITSGHLLLALTKSTDGSVIAVLSQIGIDAAAVETALPERGTANDAEGIGLTEDAKRAIEAAASAARDFPTGQIDTGHLLIGLAQAGGESAHILAGLGSDLTTVRAAVRQELGFASS